MQCDYEELYKWIEEHSISRPKRQINRDFSDALPLVEILKHHFPKLVDSHNYSPKNAHAQKLINWETLNTKVLKKLNLHLTQKRIEQLAKGEPGVIEKLLLDVKKKVDAKSAGDDNTDVYYLDTNPATPTKHSANTKRTIPIAVFEKIQADLAEKSEAVDILKNKVDHLESLLNIKDDRIKDLMQQLQVNQAKLDTRSSNFFGLFSTSNANVLPEQIKNDSS